ncbi:MAG: DNA mismatch repair endonuclease MutL [Clostridia bacterium]|nr:DNA mismatch repair endonuclease MutL [Clostridia bacterium]
MPRINVLPKNIADLIAAGEVVERPSSVIKEFVENSIDAGAKKITVEIQNGGKTYMRVTDDGCGIDREDVRKAFISHATSKISSVSDLDSISTLGFRGEALASVCAVSKVDLMTATSDSDTGTRYVIEGGEEKFIDDVGSPVGTTLVVKDLFYNIPARLKFLKKDVQEGNYVATILERIALSNPGIAFKFIRDGKIAFQTPGDGNLKSAIYAVFGKEFTSQLLPVESEMNGIKVHGFITKPTAGRGSRSMQTFFVNGRFVKSVVFLTALENAYKNSIMIGKYPACVLFVNMPYETVDVNVHPAKTEVRFFDEKRVFESIYNSALSALNADRTRPQATFSQAKIFTKPAEKGEQLNFKDVTPVVKTEPQRSFVIKEFGNPVTGEEDKVRAPEKNEPKQLDFLKDAYFKPQVKIINETELNRPQQETLKTNVVVTETHKEENIPEEDNKVNDVAIVFDKPIEKQVSAITKRVNTTPDYKYIGEAFNTYLIAEIENKIIFIDKHAAHERILFEKFKKQSAGESQMMLLPVSVNLSADEYSAVIDNLELLESAGYDVSDFGDRCVKVSACPPELVNENLSEIITEIAGYLSNNIKSLMPEKLDWIYHSMACRAAVKAGNFTSSYEAEKFVGTVLADDNIRYCPHGRPVLIEMTKREIEKQFGRIV